MNERIQELLFESNIFAKNSDGKVDTTKVHLNKFAELIVRECIRVPYDMWDKAELNADIAVKIEHRIKEHFGVEQ